MKGATEYYNIIHKAFRNKVGDLRKLKLKYGWNGGDSEAFIHGNLIFVTSTHARGECFHMYIVNTHDNDEEIKKNAIEVYGVISGNSGWTEEYGWLHRGKWVDYVLKYFADIKDQLETLELNKQMKKYYEKTIENQELQEQLNSMDSLFN